MVVLLNLYGFMLFTSNQQNHNKRTVVDIKKLKQTANQVYNSTWINYSANDKS